MFFWYHLTGDCRLRPQVRVMCPWCFCKSYLAPGTPGLGHPFRENSDGFRSMRKVAIQFASVRS